MAERLLGEQKVAGSIFLDRGNPVLSLVGSKYLLMQFLDFVSCLVKIKASIQNHKTIFRVSISGKNAEKLIKELYRDCEWFLERKNERAKSILAKT